MKGYTGLIILIPVIFTLYGCAYTPSQAELQAANYGPAPTSTRAAIVDHMQYSLKDPDSLRITHITKPRKDFYLNPANFNSQFGYGWHVCAVINAKNSYGGYAGPEPWHFWFNGNTIQWSTNASMNSGRYLICQ